jgi:hypothetical protein
VVQESVEERGGDDWVAEDLAPLGEAPVGGEYHRAPLVAGVDQLEDQAAAIGDDRQVADLVDDQERGTTEEADLVVQPALALRLGQRADEVGERDEVDAAPGLDRLDAEREARCDLPVPVEAASYCPVSGVRGSDSLSVSSAPWRNGGGRRFEASRGHGALRTFDSLTGPWRCCRRGL